MSRTKNKAHVPIPLGAEDRSWLQGFAALGCVFLEMAFRVDQVTGKVVKKPRRSLDHYKGQIGETGFVSALAWLKKGSPIGIMPRGRLWILDADNDEQVERVVTVLYDLGITPLMDTTKRGAHFPFLLPDDFPTDGLKEAVHVPKLDFIFGPNTLVVAPGSRWKDREYKAANAWFPPPVLDPRVFLPDGKFWDEPDTRPFLVSTESPARRTFAARGYLNHRAPLCIRGTGKGSKTLAKVAAQVVSYWGMKPRIAAGMMFGPGSWNSRFLDGSGKPTPFAWDEILAACKAAEGKGSEYGCRRWVEDQPIQDQRRRLESHIEILKTCLTEPRHLRVPVSEVLGVFSWLGCPDLTETKLGIALTRHGIKRVQATKRKLWSVERLNLWKLTTAMIEAERVRHGVPNVCPLMAGRGLEAPIGNEGGSLKEHQPAPLLDAPVKVAKVEQVVTSLDPSETLASATKTHQQGQGASYQTAFDWAEVTTLETLSPASAYLPKLAEMASSNLLVAMSTHCPAAIRDETIARFWPGQKAPMVSLRMMRHACRKGGLVADDGTLTSAGKVALGLQGAA